MMMVVVVQLWLIEVCFVGLVVIGDGGCELVVVGDGHVQ